MIDLTRLARDLGMIARRRAEGAGREAEENGGEPHANGRGAAGVSGANGAAASRRWNGNGAANRWIESAAGAFAQESLLDLPGAEVMEVAGEPVFAVRRDVDELYPEGNVAQAMRSAIERGIMQDSDGPRELAEVVVLDLETAGFWGYPLFVSALLFEEDGRLQTLQLMTRTYSEEGGVVRATVQILRERPHLVTFNGKSFDVPFLSERAAYHAIDFDRGALHHKDLLHPARKEFRGYFPNCKLKTLERMLLGIRRINDIPSSEIPAVFHEFIATGYLERVRDVLHHSRMDLISTGLLLGKLGEKVRENADSA